MLSASMRLLQVYETQSNDGYEVFCLIPGLQLEEIRLVPSF